MIYRAAIVEASTNLIISGVFSVGVIVILPDKSFI